MTEKQILSRLKAGDERALDTAIQTYSRLLWSIASTVLQNVASAEDMEECVADAFIQLWNNSGRLDAARGSVKTYLSVAVKTRAIDRFRKAVKKSEITLDEQLAEIGTGIFDQTLDAVLQRELLAAIQALGEPDREIVLRRFYYRQKPKDIAAVLDMTAKQVENRIFRAKQKLREQLEGGLA